MDKIHHLLLAMVAIQVYRISTAKNGKLPKHSEVVQEQEINPDGFAYARDMPKDEQNYTWYAVGEDDKLLLLTIEDLVVEKDGTILYLPVSASFERTFDTPQVYVYASSLRPNGCVGVVVQANLLLR